MSAVDNLKAQGNAAFSAKDYQKAINCYTDAIELDPDNYTLYSNRSGSYCASMKYEQAVADAKKVISLKPDWPKGYTRLGAAYQGQQDWDQAEEAFQKALELDPNNANIKSDLAEVQRKKNEEEQQAGNAFKQIFSPETLDKLRFNPKYAALFNDPSFSAMVEDVKSNPQNASKYHQDHRFQLLMQGILETLMPGMAQQAQQAQQSQPSHEPQTHEEEPEEQSQPKPAQPAPSQPATSQNLNAQAEEAKAKGNEAFKAGKLDEALEHYNKAIELDPYNVTYFNNKATVLSKQGKPEEAIKVCEEAIQMGREHNATYESIARSYQKIASAQAQIGKIDLAIESLKSSLLEKNDPQVRRELNRLEQVYEKKKAQEYENPELAEKAKQEGNNMFAAKDFPKAIELYTEAIKRAPRNPALYSNRAAAYSKLTEFPMAVKDCEKAIEIDPNFVKAYTRKAYCHYMMKEYNKARDCYNNALKLDPNNADAIDGLRSIQERITQNRYSAPDQDQINRAMSDPEIQRIIQDPGMQQIFKEIQENPAAAQQYLRDPNIAEAFAKLQAAGILR